MANHKSSRRDFIKYAGGCAALTSTSLLSTLLNLRTTNSVLAAASKNAADYRALVCIFQFGGSDSYNMLAPYETQEHADYSTIRSNLAIPHEDLLPIADSTGRQFGIHPGMPEIQELYNQGNAAFVANVGSLIQPTDINNVRNRVGLPLGLYSHSDEQRNWQTNTGQSRTQLKGWAGKVADLLTDSSNSNPTIAMNIALNRVNVMLTGESVFPYVINTAGATTLFGYNGGGALNKILTKTSNSLLSETYANLFESTHGAARRSSIDAALDFNTATQNVNLSTPFPATFLGSQLKMVARTIGAHEALGQQRQIFFVTIGGWDNHDGVIGAQANLLPQVSQAIRALYDSTIELGLADSVTTFSASDFGRTLSSNGNGSDHAWGGNHVAVGGSVKGGNVYGDYPTSLLLGNPLDTGRGRLIPTTAVDEYSAEMALWMGVQNNSELETVLPNIRNFLPSGGSSGSLGFLT